MSDYRFGTSVPIEPVSELIIEPATPVNVHNISDGYHTFSELYDHRRALCAALAKAFPGVSWRSKKHHPDDGPMFEGYFIIGFEFPMEPVTYHYKLKYWDEFRWMVEIPHAPKWDRHTPSDTVDRLLRWALR